MKSLADAVNAATLEAIMCNSRSPLDILFTYDSRSVTLVLMSMISLECVTALIAHSLMVLTSLLFLR